MINGLLVAGALLTATPFARAQDAAASGGGEHKDPDFDGKATIVLGSQHYRSGELSSALYFPCGFNLSLDLDAYRSDTSTNPVRTFTFGLGQEWERLSIGAEFGHTPRANDYQANSLDLIASWHTTSKDFRTTFGADVNRILNTYYVQFPATTIKSNLVQVVPTLSLKQRFYDTLVTVDLSYNHYNKDITAASFHLARYFANHPIAAYYMSLSPNAGVITGFPTTSTRFGLYQDLEELSGLPLKLWATYQNTHFVAVVNSSGVTADSYTAGIDYRFPRIFTATLQYNYVRQTSQPAGDYYGASLRASF